ERKLLSPVTVEPAPGAPLIFRVGESVMQLPTHGTHHRAQALAILRALGAEAPEVSYRHYAQQQGRAPS
ncbi:MAG TPA: DinB family protein, partial [Vicinamibacteria bacterium]